MIIHLFGHGGAYHCINISLTVFATQSTPSVVCPITIFLSIWLAEPALAVQAGNITASTASLATSAWTYDLALAKGTERAICWGVSGKRFPF